MSQISQINLSDCGLLPFIEIIKYLNIFDTISFSMTNKNFIEKFHCSLKDSDIAKRLKLSIRRNKLVHKICCTGNNQHLLFILKNNLMDVSDVKKFHSIMLFILIKIGNLEGLKLLVKNFSLVTKNFRVLNNFALRFACALGYLHIVKWLFESIGLNSNDAYSEQYSISFLTINTFEAFGHSKYPNISLADINNLNINLKKDNLYITLWKLHGGALFNASMRGHKEIVEYLFSKVDFSQYMCSRQFHFKAEIIYSLLNGHFDIVKYLINIYQQTCEQDLLKKIYREIYYNIYGTNNLLLLKFLTKHVNTPDDYAKSFFTICLETNNDPNIKKNKLTRKHIRIINFMTNYIK